MTSLLTSIIILLLQSARKKETQDKILDFFEDLIADSETELDDKVLLPLIRAYRKAADVPDNDE